MINLKDLPEITSRQLGGLEATPTIWAKAKLSAADYHKPQMRKKTWQSVLAISTALALCIGAAYWATDENRNANIPSPQNMIDSYSAGDSNLPTVAPAVSADVPVGSISMSAGNRSNSSTLFATSNGSSFPLITINGATYRMLNSPNSISSGLLGGQLGNVSEFNIEPALGSSGVVSNIVAQGEAIYAISGLSGSLVAANVDGNTRVFQRVSYAGTAIIGSEKLGDTLCAPSDVEWISLDGVGTITDTDEAQILMKMLLDNASYVGTSFSGSGSLQIGLSNGLTLQLLTNDDAVSACGTWSSPDFFEAFHEAVGQ